MGLAQRRWSNKDKIAVAPIPYFWSISMKLYYAPGACSLSPHVVLREAGMTFDLDKVDLGEKKTSDGSDFTKISPLGYVPALQLDDGEVLTEGAAIVQYLADQAPAAKLMPEAGTTDRYKAQEWLTFISSELHKGFSPLFNPALPDEMKSGVITRLETRFDYVEKQLAGKQYLMGDAFSVVDAYGFTILNWANFKDIDLSRWPNISAYMGRVAARPKVNEALKAEGLVE
jgi:glutathione S-transferase